MYVRKSLAAIPAPQPYIGDGCDALAVRITDTCGRSIVTVINAYGKDNSLDLQHLETYVDSDFAVLTGDLNAIHCTLGRNRTVRHNRNGLTLYRWLTDASISHPIKC